MIGEAPSRGGWSGRELVRLDPDGIVVVATDVEVADGWLRRLVGWIGRAVVRDQTALWLPATRGVHTAGLRTAIDVVFLDPAGRVLALRRRLRPWRIAVGPRATAAVVELAPGRTARAGIRIGQRLSLRCRPEARCGTDG